MKETSLLESLELRLSSPTSSRCELYISAEGESEKLACGFSKTLLSHLRAARELLAAGARSILRLEGPRVYNGTTKPWFTKGTLERFVLYVSTPEVLERAKAIEEELVQLQRVRNIQAGSLPQAHGSFSSTNITVSRAGFVLPDYRAGYYHGNEADSSKKELLRAMDVRLSALQQEQEIAFSQAAAAGFCVESIKDLLAFSEYFGADQLRVACNRYHELLSKRQKANDKVADSSSQGMKSPHLHRPEAMELESPQKTFEIDDTLQTRRVGEEPMNFHSPSSPDELEDGSPVDASPVRWRIPTTKGLPQRTSPRRRSASPLKKVQLGRFGSRRAGSVAIRSINYFPERQSKEKNQDMDTSSSGSEDNALCVMDDTSCAVRSSPADARRLSVQAAINLFESKQSKDTDDIQGKQRFLKPQSRRGSLDGSNSCVSSTFDLKQPGQGDHYSSDEHWQDSGVSMRALNTDESHALQIEQTTKSPGNFANLTQYELKVENNSVLQGGCIQSSRKDFSPKEALFLARGSSTSEDCLTSELDSIEESRTPELAESDFFNSKSTITSISHSDVHTEKSSLFSESRLFQATPANLTPSVLVNKGLYSQASEGFDQYQATSLVQNEPGISEGNEIGIKERNLSFDLTLQALAKAACQEISGSNEGRFYEHYRKLRDAKMMEEEKSRRAEREAKLRLMEETLDLRKAEMDARTAKLNKNGGYAKARAAKLLTLKADLREMQSLQEDRDNDYSKGQVLSRRDSMRSDNSPSSPPLTPRRVKERPLSPKLHRSRRAVAPSQKTFTPRMSSRSVSVSPKTTPQGTVRKVSIQQTVQTAALNVPENSLRCSVPCFSDLKTENAKPSPGKQSGCAPSNSKNGGPIAFSPFSSRASLLDSNGTIPLQINSSTRNVRIDKKNKQRPTRRSTMISGLRETGLTTEEEISVNVNTQKDDVRIDGIIASKVRQNTVAPIQEVRPFLRKGTGIGPGAGPGLMKHKSEAVKSSDEDASVTPKVSDEESPAGTRNVTGASDEAVILVEGTVEDIPSHSLSHVCGYNKVVAQAQMMADDITQHLDEGLSGACNEAKLKEPSGDDELSDNERACHTISFPIDLATHCHYASKIDTMHQQVCHQGIVKREEASASATLSQLFSENSSQAAQNEASVNGSASFRASLAIGEQNASRFSPLKATSLASSSLKRLGAAIPDYFSPSGTRMAESPVASPASWNTSQFQYASEMDATRTQKRFASEKPVVVIVPPKEPARGFKRLLKFGRKSRAAPEIIVMDGAPASTPSEGDDEGEEVMNGVDNYSAHDVTGKVKLQGRLLKEFRIASPKGVQSFESAIPNPPSNFQLNYDHAPGTSKLKAPRSFFSLSTFRSKASEGRSR